MEKLEQEQTTQPNHSRAQEIYRSAAVLAIMLVGVVGVERLAHGEEDCVQHNGAYEVSFNVPGCVKDVTGIDPLQLAVND